MPKDRVFVATSPVEDEPRRKGQRESAFMITINPQKSWQSERQAGFQEMQTRLKALSNYLLRKKTILSLLQFPKEEVKDGVKIPRQVLLGRIDEISKDRVASCEWGSKQGRLHVHIYLAIKHRSFIRLDVAKIREIAATLLKVPAEGLHLDIQASSPSLRDYVMKGVDQ